jgi:methyl-accepting chemotaxis protein
MHILALPINFFEIVIFSLAVLAFILAVRFFIQSQKRLEEIFPQPKRKKRRFRLWLDRDGFIVPAIASEQKSAPSENFTYKVLERDEETKEEIKELKAMLISQQLELTRAIRQMDTINATREARPFYNEDEDEVYEEVEEYEEKLPFADNEKLEKLRLLLQERETELQELQQQVELSKKIQGHFEEVRSGYEELQQKVQKMEQQAWQAADLAIKLDSIEQSYEQLEKNALKKDEKLRELSVESSRLHEVLSLTEDKLSEANLQRQQLMKKVQFLEEINNDIQQMTEANRKLKNELRRVAELESMLSLITEERDVLLKRRS